MVSDQELRELVNKARTNGLEIEVEIDKGLERDEGRKVIGSVRVITRGQGIGPYPMPPIAAAERLREWQRMHNDR